MEPKTKVDELREALARRQAREDAPSSAAPEAVRAGDDPDVTAPIETVGGPAGSADQAMTDLLTRLEQTETQSTAAHERYVRTVAEFENTRKRLEREQRDAVQFANERLLRDLLPVLDHLDEALGSCSGSEANGGAAAVRALAEGVELTRRQLLSVVATYGLAEITAEAGIKFDPAQHEAVAPVDAEGIATGHIVTRLRRGYALNGRVIRAALVSVAR